MKKIYLANDLFSEATLTYNEMLYNKLIEMGFEVYAPQKNTAINDKSKSASSVEIYNGDTEKLEWSDILLAVIDGPVIDPGVASEIGWIAGFNESNSYLNTVATMYGDEEPKPKKIILGLYTDTRDGFKTATPAKTNMMLTGSGESQYCYANLYTVGAIKKHGKLFGSSKDLFEYLGDEFSD